MALEHFQSLHQGSMIHQHFSQHYGMQPRSQDLSSSRPLERNALPETLRDHSQFSRAFSVRFLMKILLVLICFALIYSFKCEVLMNCTELALSKCYHHHYHHHHQHHHL